MSKTLPYYRINKTEEDKQFFYAHEGYFNFWDKYLIMHIPSYDDIFTILVNRTDDKFGRKEIETEDYKICRNLWFSNSVYLKEPKEMFIDFPELQLENLSKEEYL